MAGLWVFVALCGLSLFSESLGATLLCGAGASNFSGFSCYTQALGHEAFLVVVCIQAQEFWPASDLEHAGFSSCGLWTLECRLNNCSRRA